LARQKTTFEAGAVLCAGHPCQKQPSTKIATLDFGKTKSGRTHGRFEVLVARVALGRGSDKWRRHPLIPWIRSNRMNSNSVALLPRPRIRDITSERFDTEKTSAMPKDNGNNGLRQAGS
jgi:hypothetical protein